MRISRVLMLLAILVGLWQYVHYVPLLPDTMATHFNQANQANGWTATRAFLLGSLGILAGALLIWLLIRGRLYRLPSSAFNLPNREYWLAPERRGETIGAIERQIEWFVALTMAYLAGMTQLTIEANLRTPPQMGGEFWVLFWAYLALLLGWIVLLIRRTLTANRQAA